jgi:hypothetical protein
MVMATNKLRMVNFEMLIFDCGFKKKEMRQIKIADSFNKTRSFEKPYRPEPKLYFDRIYRIKTDGESLRILLIFS